VRENRRHPNEISLLAGRQHGYVTRAQLLALGLSDSAIRRRVASGQLIPVHAGVYAVGHVPRSAVARAAAAVLACGDGAVLSHGSALALWGVGDWPARPEVTAPAERRRPGIRTHRSRTLTAHDVRRQGGVRVTSPVRTVIDTASRLTDARLIRIVNEVRLAGHLKRTALEELLARSARARRLLGSPEQRPTRSGLEDLFRRFAARHRLPMPEVNARVDGREVDALYREPRLIVELDGWIYHQDRRSFETDRAKDFAALAEDYVTIRITEERLRQSGAAEADQIRRILRRRGDQYRPSPRA
jgi:very-short-patch-repair endonuclease